MDKINVTLNPSDMVSGSILSNSNLTVTQNTLVGFIRATHGRTTGKWYWEVKLDSGYIYSSFGITNQNYNLASGGVSNVNLRAYRGNGYRNPENDIYGSKLLVGEVVGIALELDNGVLEFYKNGASMGISHTNLSELGEVFPTIGAPASNSRAMTINFGSTPFIYDIPKGFYSYNGNQYGAFHKHLFQSNSGEVNSFVKGNDIAYSDNLIPKMTNNTVPSGVASASNYYSSYAPYLAFDNLDTGNGWLSRKVDDPTPWLAYQFPTPKIIAKYSLFSNSVARMPVDWTFEGSNDDAWTVLDVRNAVTDWVINTEKEFTFENKVAYLKYRINITKGNGDASYIGISELKMMEVSIPKLVSYPKKLTTLLTEQEFINHGIDDISVVDPKEVIERKGYMTNQSTTLGFGKTFENEIDLDKYKTKKITFQ